MEPYLVFLAGIILGVLGTVLANAIGESEYSTKTFTVLLADKVKGKRVLPKKAFLYHPSDGTDERNGVHTFLNENASAVTIDFKETKGVKGPFGPPGTFTVPAGTPQQPGELQLEEVTEPSTGGTYWKYMASYRDQAGKVIKLDPGVRTRK